MELLELEDVTLDDIEMNNPHDAKNRCKELLSLWLQRSPTASWNKIIQALRKIQLNDTAAKIERMLHDSGGN